MDKRGVRAARASGDPSYGSEGMFSFDLPPR